MTDTDPWQIARHVGRPCRDSRIQSRLAPDLRARGSGYPGGVQALGHRGAPGRQHLRAGTGGKARPGYDADRRRPGGGPRSRPRMTALGYLYSGENGIPGRFYFDRVFDGRTVAHVHMLPVGHPDARKHLVFRDHLRTHPDTATRLRATEDESSRRSTGTTAVPTPTQKPTSSTESSRPQHVPPAVAVLQRVIPAEPDA